jgi:hypothetical protein
MTDGDLIPALPFAGRPEISEQIVLSYHKAWDARPVPGRNPCPQPVSLERRHLQLIKDKPYVVADKSDGIRMCLFLTRVEGKEYSVLINRMLTIFQIAVCASSKCFNGSLFDGELLWTVGTDGVASQTYLVFDVVSWRGDNGAIGLAQLPKRLELIRHCFDFGGDEVSGAEAAHKCAKSGKVVCGGNAHGLAFRPKKCYSLEMLPTLLRQMPHLSYVTDGIILTPINDPVTTGTNERQFKLKWSQTLDFQVIAATRQLLLGVGAGGHDERLDITHCPYLKLEPDDLFWEKFALSVLPSDCPVNTIVEASLKEDETGTILLTYLTIRRDKTHPNSIRTAQRTLISVKEDLNADDLLAIFDPRNPAR